MEVVIPKTLWVFWVNFKDKIYDKEFSLDPYDCLSHIKNLKVKKFILLMLCTHNKSSDWNVNIISTKQILSYFVEKMEPDDQEFINMVIKNDVIKPAHKSDVIRYLLLKTFGGVWVDATTFIFNDISSLIENKTFIVPYMNIYQGINLFFGNPSQKILSNDSKEIKPIKEDLFNSITISENNLDFIPENYFIASTKNHFILIDVIKQLKDFWRKNIADITMKNYDDILVDYMYELTYGNIFISEKWNYKPIDRKDFTEMWIEAAYLFNYIQLFFSIKTFLNNLDCLKNIKQLDTDGNAHDLIHLNLYDPMIYKKECSLNNDFFDSCNDMIINCKDNENINLISASYLRLFRKNQGDKTETLYETMIDNFDYDTFKKELFKNRQYFIKVSSYSINHKFVDRIIKYINDNIFLMSCKENKFGGKYRRHNKSTHKMIKYIRHCRNKSLKKRSLKKRSLKKRSLKKRSLKKKY
jgi:hypothetical protein